MKKTLAVIGIVAVAGIGLLTLGHSGGGVPIAHQSQQANVGVTAGNVSNAQLAPDFALSKLGGGTVSLTDYKGKKPVVLDFWASWCPNCRRDMPHLNQLYQTYKNKVEVIGVNLQEDPGMVQRFVASQGINYPIALDPYSQASQAYGIQGTNTHVLIDKSGNLVRIIPGDIQESDIASLVNG